MNSMELGKRLKEARKDLGFSQACFASALGVSKGQVSRYEAGINSPTSGALARVSAAFNISLDWLLTGQGKRYRNPGKERSSGGAGTAPESDLGQDRRLVRAFRFLSDEEKELAIEIVKLLANRRVKKR